jgi:hypothetical protein
MTHRVRDLLLGVILALVTLIGVLYQIAASTPSADSNRANLPRLVCPLH